MRAFVVCSLLMVFPIGVVADERTAKEMIARSNELAVFGDHVGAAREYLAAIRKDGSLASIQQIRSLRSTPDLPPAQAKELEKVLAEAARLYASMHADEWGAVALLVSLSSSATAERLLTDWLASHADDADALSLRANVRARAGRYDDAVADWEKLIALRPDDPSRHAELGAALVKAVEENAKVSAANRAKWIGRAETALRRALELDPQSFAIQASLNGALRLRAAATKDPEEKRRISEEAAAGERAALEQFAKTVALPPRMSLAIRQRGRPTLRLEDRDVVRLERAPFTLEFRRDVTIPVRINVYTADVIQRLVDRGLDIRKACNGGGKWAFCPRNLAREAPLNQDQKLAVGWRLWNNLYYNSATDHAWSEVREGAAGRHRRVVSKIDATPIEETKDERLFLTAVADLDGDDRVEVGEYYRFTIEFVK